MTPKSPEATPDQELWVAHWRAACCYDLKVFPSYLQGLLGAANAMLFSNDF
jgi:hypothetical protein